jgi:hypothetical protein
MFKKKSLPLTDFFEEPANAPKFRVKREFVSGPSRGMIVTEITTKSFKINKLVKNKKSGNYRVLSVENL